MVKKVDPTLEEVKQWFENEIIPKRTTSAGLSSNRVSMFFSHPIDYFFGENKANPNGLCGDAADYVLKAYKKNLVIVFLLKTTIFFITCCGKVLY